MVLKRGQALAAIIIFRHLKTEISDSYDLLIEWLQVPISLTETFQEYYQFRVKPKVDVEGRSTTVEIQVGSRVGTLSPRTSARPYATFVQL